MLCIKRYILYQTIDRQLGSLAVSYIISFQILHQFTELRKYVYFNRCRLKIQIFHSIDKTKGIDKKKGFLKILVETNIGTIQYLKYWIRRYIIYKKNIEPSMTS